MGETNSLHGFMKTGVKKTIAKGQIFQTNQDTEKLNMIEYGFVKRFLITKDGAESVQAIYGPGHVFPLTIVFLEFFNQKIYQGKETYFYQAITKVSLFCKNIKDVHEESKKNNEILLDLLKESGKRLRSNINKLENKSYNSAFEQLSHRLLHLALAYGIPRGKSRIIDMPIRHQDLADMLNMSRETVSKNLTKLRDTGLITTDKVIIVTDIDGLRDLVYS